MRGDAIPTAFFCDPKPGPPGLIASMHLRFVLPFALPGALLFAPQAKATTMVEAPLDALIERADLVVRGRVKRVGARVVLGKAGLEPDTHVWLRVQEQWVGPSIAGFVHLWEPSGAGGSTVRTYN